MTVICGEKFKYRFVIPIIMLLFLYLVIFFTIGRIESSYVINGTPTGTAVSGQICVEISSTNFCFNGNEISGSTVAPSVYTSGHYSVLDALIHINNTVPTINDLQIEYMSTFDAWAITNLLGSQYWWYKVSYDGGQFEDNRVRMEHYLVKTGTEIQIIQMSMSERNAVYTDYLQPGKDRLDGNSGVVIIPTVRIRDQHSQSVIFNDVAVTAFNTRSDVYQNGIFSVVDVLLTLANNDDIDMEMKWLNLLFGEHGGPIVDSYRVSTINGDSITGACGWTFQCGETQSGMNLIHQNMDERILYSPNLVLLSWTTLGSCEPFEDRNPPPDPNPNPNPIIPGGISEAFANEITFNLLVYGLGIGIPVGILIGVVLIVVAILVGCGMWCGDKRIEMGKEMGKVEEKLEKELAEVKDPVQNKNESDKKV